MIREWKALVQFNMRYFTYHQWLLAIAVFVISNLVTLLYYGDLVSSTIDAFIFHFAVFEGADILTIIHTLLPFFVLAYIVDLYMENNFHENLLYTLLRISNRNAWALAHLTVLFAIHVVYLFFITVCPGSFCILFISQVILQSSIGQVNCRQKMYIHNGYFYSFHGLSS